MGNLEEQQQHLILDLRNRLTSYLEGRLSVPDLVKIETLINEIQGDIDWKDGLYSEWGTIEIAYASALHRVESSEGAFDADLPLTDRDLNLIQEAVNRIFSLLGER
jgi:hypothetical protein